MHKVTLAQNTSYACLLQPKVLHKRSYLRIVVQGKFCCRNTRRLALQPRVLHRLVRHVIGRTIGMKSRLSTASYMELRSKTAKRWSSALRGKRMGLGLGWHSRKLRPLSKRLAALVACAD